MRRSFPYRRTFAAFVATATAAGFAVTAIPTPAGATAGPSGGPAIAVTCNQFTHGPDGFTITDQFAGLVGGSAPPGYQVSFTYTDTNGPESFYDENYWYAENDGTYNHVYHLNFDIPSGTNVTWQLKEFNGVEIDHLLDGSVSVTGTCSPKAPKPGKPTITNSTITVSKKGKFDVPLVVDAKTHGSVTLSDKSGQLASGGYVTASKTNVAVELKLGKADLKHLKKVGHEDLKAVATSINGAGSAKDSAVITLKMPKKK